MKVVNKQAHIDPEKCIGCTICSKVCPTNTITMKDRKAVIDPKYCYGCNACFSRCEHGAVTMEAVEPFTVSLDFSAVPQKDIEDLCEKAHMFPKKKVCCVCVTKAEEVAAAILMGAKNPIDIARMTGVGTGCKIFCSQSVARLFEAAGIDMGTAPGWQWYGKVADLWSIPEDVKAKYNDQYYFDDDIRFNDECNKIGLEKWR